MNLLWFGHYNNVRYPFFSNEDSNESRRFSVANPNGKIKRDMFGSIVSIADEEEDTWVFSDLPMCDICRD